MCKSDRRILAKTSNLVPAFMERGPIVPNRESILLQPSSEYQMSAPCNHDAKNCGFRGAMDTSDRRIPDVSGVLVYGPWRLVYQNLCRPRDPVDMKSGVRQEFGSPAHGVSPLADLDNRDVRRLPSRVSL